MKRIAAVFLCLSLCACYSDQRQQLAACRVDDEKETKYDPSATINDLTFLSSGRIELCMGAHGYEVVTQAAPECVGPSALAVKDAPKKLAQALSARCYAPMGWAARQVFDLERQWGHVD